MLLTILSFLFVFTVLALAHEGGHFYFAKRAGIRIHEFGIGFGPRIFSIKKGKTIYSLNAIPILAFVRIAGADTESASDSDDKETPENEKFYSKTLLQRFLATVAGPIANLIVAFVVLAFIFALIGVPTGLSNEVGSIVKNSIAEKAGLKPGDKIISINHRPYKAMDEIIALIHKSAGQDLTLGIMRNNTNLELHATPKLDEKLKVGLIGFAPKPKYEKVNLIKAIYHSARQTLYLSLATIYVVGMLLIGKISITNLAGPVGIAQITGQYAHSGIISLLNFLALLNINIGVLNLLPLPALDGGRIVFQAIEAVRRRRIDPGIENKIHQWGLIVLLILMALITINDLARLIST